MKRSDWLGGLRTNFSSLSRRRTARRPLRGKGSRLRSISAGGLEPLEPRLVMATLLVNSWLDNTTAGDGMVTLREAIRAANNNTATDLGDVGSGADTIVFHPTTFGIPRTVQLSLGELTISEALEIDGSAANQLTIDGQLLSRIFNVTAAAGSVALEDLKLTRGKAPGDGGAIRVANAAVSLSLDHVSITGNSAVGNGGAIFAAGAVTATLSTLNNNSAVGNLIAGIRAQEVELLDSTVSGGISATADVELTNSTVTDKGIDGGNIQLTNSNVAGGIYGDSVDLDGSTVAGGVNCSGAFIDDSTVQGQVSTAFGAVLTNATIIGGGVSMSDAGPAGLVISLTNSKVTGGDIAFNGLNPGGSVTLTNSVLTGGNVNARHANVKIQNSSILGGSVSAGQSGSINVVNSLITGGGVGLTTGRFYSGSISVVSSTISGGGVGISLTHTYRGSGGISVSDSVITNNLSGGIYMATSGGGVSVSGSLITNNGHNGGEATGGIRAPSVSVSKSTISGNRGTRTFMPFYNTTFSGVTSGGITSPSVSLTDSTVSGNMTSGSGGGIFANSVVLDRSTVSGNTAAVNGGGIFSNGIALTNSTISGNTATGNGGGIASNGKFKIGPMGGYFSNEPVTVKYSTIAGNQAAVGGGIWKDAGPLGIQSSIVATNSGGGNPDLRPGTSTLTLTTSLIGDKTGTSLTEAQTPDGNGNLIGSASGSGVINPLLGPLADNGGPTQTHALLAGSPAIDRINYDPPVVPPLVSDSAVHIYELNGSLVDSKSGPDLETLGGTLTAGGYQFAANQGLNLSSPDIDPAEYSIEILFSWDTVTSGWQKILDFQDLAADPGLYTLNAGLQFTDEAYADGNLFTANVPAHLVLTRDDVTDTVRAYINGIQFLTFTDSEERAVFTGENSIVRFFQDDFATSQAEAQAGFVDRIRIFDRVLNSTEIGELFNPPPPPVSDVPSTDQRGPLFARVFDGDGVNGAKIDMGAYEKQAVVVPALAGDFNGDSHVDAADFTLWRDQQNATVASFSGADGDGDGKVDLTDYAIWRRNFGSSLPPGSGSGALLAATSTAAFAEEAAAVKTGAALETPNFDLRSRGGHSDAVFSLATASADVESGIVGRESRALQSAVSLATRTDAALLAWQATRGAAKRTCADGTALREAAAEDDALGESIAAVESVFELLGA